MLHYKTHRSNIYSVLNKAEISKNVTQVIHKQPSLHYQNMPIRIHKYAMADITNVVIKVLRHHRHRYILVYS